MMRVRRDVRLSSARPEVIPGVHWLRIVRTAGLGAVTLFPERSGGDTERIALHRAFDGWIPLGGRKVKVLLDDVTNGASCTCDIEWLDEPLAEAPPLAAPRTVVLVDQAFDHTALGLGGILSTVNTALYPNGADLLGFRLDAATVVIPAGWAGSGTQVQVICLIKNDAALVVEGTDYASAQVSTLYTAGASPANAIRFFGRFGNGGYRSDFNTNAWSLSSMESPGVDSRYFDVALRAIAGTLTAAPGSRIQLRGRPLR